MADVFLSYKRSERPQVERIASMLRGLGLNVWFDAGMSAGDTFNDEIDREARAAKAVLVCWSPEARESEWVKAEAMIGFTQKKLAACYVAGPDGFDPPTPFNTRHAEDLRGWFAAPSEVHSGWKSVLRSLGKLCGRADIESYGALDTQATAADLRAWIDAHEQSPLFVTVDGLLRQRETEEAERGRIEQEARERRAEQERERRAREAAERAAREEEERRRPRPVAPVVVTDHDFETSVDTTPLQPRGVATLFLTELFERFAYYGTRALLILYLVQPTQMSDVEASRLYGAFTSLIYLFPILGAIVADRIIGARRSVLFGSLLLVAGYAALTLSALVVTGSQLLIYLALALVIVGSAYLKPSLFATMGALFTANDPRRDGGFTFLYIAVNLGAFVAVLVTGYVGDRFGWAAAFALATSAMILAVACYLAGQNNLRRTDLAEGAAPGRQSLAWLLAGGGVLAAFLMLSSGDTLSQLTPYLAVGAFVAVFLYVLAGFSGEERSRLMLAFVLIGAGAAFWALFEVSGSAFALFAEFNVDFSGASGLTASQFQALSPIVVVVAAIPLALIWIALARSKLEPGVGVKFALGLALVGASFMAAAFGAQFANADAQVPFEWLALVYLLQGLGELFVSPIGLSAMTKLAPMRMASLMIAVWYLGSLLGNALASWINSFSTASSQVLDPATTLAQARDIFLSVGIAGLVIGLVVLALWPFLSRLARGVR